MMNKTKKGQSTKAWDVVPEVGEYDVKYEGNFFIFILILFFFYITIVNEK